MCLCMFPLKLCLHLTGKDRFDPYFAYSSLSIVYSLIQSHLAIDRVKEFFRIEPYSILKNDFSISYTLNFLFRVPVDQNEVSSLAFSDASYLFISTHIFRSVQATYFYCL